MDRTPGKRSQDAETTNTSTATMPPTVLPLRHLLLALAVVAVWGTNFVVIRQGLDELPPLLFATLRFVFALVPAVFFLRRPDVSWRNLAIYGLATGAGQFGLLFLAMRGHISPGLASLVIQAQVFFTIGLSVWRTGERVRPFQGFALALGALGVAVIGAHTDAATTPLGLALVLGAALAWAIANLAVRSSGTTDMLAYVVWASLFAAPSLLALSLAFEGRCGDRRRAAAREPGRLGGGRLAIRRQHAVRLRGLGLALGALPRRHRDAHGPAGAGVRHGGVGGVARRAASGLEDRGHAPGHGRTRGRCFVSAMDRLARREAGAGVSVPRVEAFSDDCPATLSEATFAFQV